MAGEKAKGSKKNRKHGNNRVFCAKYEQESRKILNKTLKLMRHLRKFKNDSQAKKVFKSAPELVKKSAQRRYEKLKAECIGMPVRKIN